MRAIGTADRRSIATIECRMHTEAEISTMFDRLPSVLTIHLKRFAAMCRHDIRTAERGSPGKRNDVYVAIPVVSIFFVNILTTKSRVDICYRSSYQDVFWVSRERLGAIGRLVFA